MKKVIATIQIVILLLTALATLILTLIFGYKSLQDHYLKKFKMVEDVNALKRKFEKKYPVEPNLVDKDLSEWQKNRGKEGAKFEGVYQAKKLNPFEEL
jgi:hypothetical protein